MSSTVTILKHIKHEPSDGRPPIRYSIQLMDKSLIDEAALFWAKYFRPRENLNISLDEQRFGEPETTNIDWITNYLSEGMPLAAFLEDDRGNRGALIGFNSLVLKRNEHSETQDSRKKDQPETESVSERRKVMLQTLADVEAKTDVFTLYNCSSYMDFQGLVVSPEYGRRGISSELLRAQGEVCRMTGTAVSASVFTGEASQTAAASCGFRTLSELDLTSYRFNDELIYSNPKWPVIKWMAKRYF